MSKDFTKLADQATIDTTIEALNAKGFSATFAADAAAAQEAVRSIIPKGAEVLTNTSATLDATGIADIIENSGEFDSVRAKLQALGGDSTKEKEKRQLGSAPDFAIGSAHAVTEDGDILIASATGSQLAGYVFGAEKVVLVISAQKIVKDLSEARERLEKHVFPLEDARALEAYGVNSAILREFIFHGDMPGRVHVIILGEVAGF